MRVGFIGTGNIAHAHLGAYRELPDVEVVAGADIIPGKAKEFFERNGVPGAAAYTDYREMIKNEHLDAVSVCTYNTAHKEPSVFALRSGVAVLLEKPFASSYKDALEIMKAEKESGTTLSIGFQPRFNKNNILITDTIKSGRLGEVYYVRTGGGRYAGVPGETFIEKRYAGCGAMGDIGCYSLDLILHALSYPKPLTVSAYTSDFFGGKTKYYPKEDAERFDVEDFAAAFIRFEGGLVMDFVISWDMHADTTGDMLLLGKEGAMRIPSTFCWNGAPGGPVTIYYGEGEDRKSETLPFFETDENDPYSDFRNKVGSFLQAAKEHKPGPVSSSEIITNQLIIDAVILSAKEGREISVEEVEK